MSLESHKNRILGVQETDPERWLTTAVMEDLKDWEALKKLAQSKKEDPGPAGKPTIPSRKENRPGNIDKNPDTYFPQALQRRDDKERLDPRGQLPDNLTRDIRGKKIGTGALNTLKGDKQPMDAPSLDKLKGATLESITDHLSDMYSRSNVQGDEETDEAYAERRRLPLTLPGKKGGRKNANFNFMELIVAAHLSDPNASTVKEIIQAVQKMKNISGAEQYLDDLNQRDPRKVLKAAEALRNSNSGFTPDLEQIYLKNTNKQMAPPSIIQSLSGLEDKVRRDKADVMFYDMKDEKYKGISIKDSPSAWEDSPSIEGVIKRMSEARGTKNQGDLLKDIRMQMHKDAGLPISEVDALSQYGDSIYLDEKGERHDSVTGELRKKLLQTLLSNTNTPYANQVSNFITDGDWFMNDWKRAVHGEDLPYEFHKFNGQEFERMDSSGDWRVERARNPGAGGSDDIPKDFYTFFQDDEPVKGAELRFKQPFNSAQLITFPWKPGWQHKPYDS